METIAGYVQSSLQLPLIEVMEPVELQRSTPELLTDLVVSVPYEVYARPSPGKSVVIAGPPAVKIVSSWCYRLIRARLFLLPGAWGQTFQDIAFLRSLPK